MRFEAPWPWRTLHEETRLLRLSMLDVTGDGRPAACRISRVETIIYVDG